MIVKLQRFWSVYKYWWSKRSSDSECDYENKEQWDYLYDLNWKNVQVDMSFIGDAGVNDILLQKYCQFHSKRKCLVTKCSVLCFSEIHSDDFLEMIVLKTNWHAQIMLEIIDVRNHKT